MERQNLVVYNNKGLLVLHGLFHFGPSAPVVLVIIRKDPKVFFFRQFKSPRNVGITADIFRVADMGNICKFLGKRFYYLA